MCLRVVCVCFFWGGLLLRIYVVVMFVVYCVRLDVLLLCCVLRVCACLCVCVCVFVCDLLCDGVVSVFLCVLLCLCVDV